MTTSVFYDKFDRHAHGEGLKGHATHYCAGCGHGLAHKYLAEAIDELGIQDRTVAVSPVGCAVFLYYYFDVGNTQAPHGRAPAVAIGHKVANPDSIVISYQGDGDLASIGLAEIVHAAQLGLPITVVFINNAIYGMTGGQMAPTTLTGMKTTTSPYGRDQFEGLPMKVSEMVSTLAGTVYVERCALFDAQQRNRAKKAIKKGLQLQVDNRGFSLIEILAECPTHLRMDPPTAEKWVKETMLPVFPLGVHKDVDAEVRPPIPTPTFDADTLLGVVQGTTEAMPKHCDAFPTHIDPADIALKLAGAGGDGAQTAAMLLTRAAINEGFDATHIPSYGPESRGGTSYADVHVAAEEVLSPASPSPHILVAFNAPSLAKFGPTVIEGGVIVYDSSVITDAPTFEGVKMYGIPFLEIATALGKPVVKNVVALGALQAASHLFPPETILTAIRQALADKCAMIPLNEQAFLQGIEAVTGLTH